MVQVNKTLIAELDVQLKKLQQAREGLTNPVSGTVGTTAANDMNSPSVISSQEKEKELQKMIEIANSFLTGTSAGVDNAITQAANSSGANSTGTSLNIPEIPGVTPGLGSPISLSVSPTNQ